MLIVVLLGAGLVLAFGFAVMLVAFAIDTFFCHRRSELVGPARQGSAATPPPIPRPQSLSRRTVSAEAG